MTILPIAANANGYRRHRLRSLAGLCIGSLLLLATGSSTVTGNDGLCPAPSR